MNKRKNKLRLDFNEEEREWAYKKFSQKQNKLYQEGTSEEDQEAEGKGERHA